MLAGALPCKQLIMGTHAPDGPSVHIMLLRNTTAEEDGKKFVCEKRDRAITWVSFSYAEASLYRREGWWRAFVSYATPL